MPNTKDMWEGGDKQCNTDFSFMDYQVGVIVQVAQDDESNACPPAMNQTIPKITHNTNHEQHRHANHK